MDMVVSPSCSCPDEWIHINPFLLRFYVIVSSSYPTSVQTIPYRGPIKGGMKRGRTITIKGKVNPNATRSDWLPIEFIVTFHFEVDIEET